MGIRAKLLIPLLVLTSLFLLGLQHFFWPRLLEAQLERHIIDEQARAEVLGTALVHPLRNSDLAQVYSILGTALSKHPRWVGITLLDVDGTRIYPFDVTTGQSVDNLVELRHLITFFDTPIGTLLISLDESAIYRQHDSYVRRGQILILILLGLAVLISFPLQERLITSPLQALASAARRLASGDFDSQLPRAGGDEVGQLIRSFDKMRADIKKSHDRLHQLAHYDSLTGLPNRAMFLDRLEHAIAHARRDGKPLGLLLLDIDNFKAINDTLGHVAGDAMVAAVAERLSSITREGDTIARLGGDEFMIIIETMNAIDEAAIAAERIVEVLRTPLSVGGQLMPVTASIGVTTYPQDADEASALVQNSDIAMYRAKAGGGGTFKLFAEDTRGLDRSGLELRSQLYHALERDQYFLEFQPRIDLRSGKTACVEALIRWQLPGESSIGPKFFVPLLEQTGLIVEVGEWVLHQSCHFFRDQLNAGLDPVNISVNLSVRQFRDPHLRAKIEGALKEYDVPANCLELELTESLVMEDTTAACEILDAMHSLGVRLSIDDFGTGYSSLSYLKRFPVDFLKIDRSFINDLPGDQDDVAIVRSILALSRSLGIATIAEGIENERQLQFLNREGCDGAQGYLFGAPLRRAEMLAWLADHNENSIQSQLT